MADYFDLLTCQNFGPSEYCIVDSQPAVDEFLDHIMYQGLHNYNTLFVKREGVEIIEVWAATSSSPWPHDTAYRLW